MYFCGLGDDADLLGRRDTSVDALALFMLVIDIDKTGDNTKHLWKSSIFRMWRLSLHMNVLDVRRKSFTLLACIRVWPNLRESSPTEEHALAKQIKLRSAIHLSFDGLEFVDFALGLPIAFRATQCRFNGRQISLHPVGQLNKLRDGTLPSRNEPSRQSLNRSLTEHLGKRLSQLEGKSDLRMKCRGARDFLHLRLLSSALVEGAQAR
jgi:hypothetical protein